MTDKPLTLEQIKRFAAKIAGNGLPAGVPIQHVDGPEALEELVRRLEEDNERWHKENP
jgi:hypothetical protein